MGEFRRNALIAALAAGVMLIPVRCGTAAGPAIELGSGFGEFTVVSRGESIALNSTVEVQQLVNGEWVHASVTNLYLRESCGSTQPERCRVLKPGETIKVAPWTGNYCSSQCPSACRLDGPAPVGAYRFAVTSCDGKETFVSPKFQKKQ